MKQPLISVLLPTYNAMTYLPGAVDSIIAQTVTCWHLVIVDDGSTDGTGDYLDGLQLQLGPKLTTIRWRENLGSIQGISPALNEGLKACNGLYVARMDADDISLPNRFQEQLLFLLEYPEIDGVGAWIQFFGNENRMMDFPIDPDEVRDLLFERTTVAHPTYFFRRQVYQEFQYDTSYRQAEDLDFLLRVTERYRISNVPKILLRYRSDYKRCRSCQDLDTQTQCMEWARAEARKRRGLE